METKTFRLKDAILDQGKFTAIFATMGVVDKQNDLTLPGAFGEQRVIISGYGHASWNGGVDSLPVGKGRIFERGNDAIVEGEFFLDTTAGQQTFKTIQAVGDLQEFSYALPEIESEMRTIDGQNVRVLKKIKVGEVSPVLLGAGIGTRILDIKSEMKPYPSEHACRLHDPGDYDKFARKNCEIKHEGKCIDVIYGIKAGKSEIQAYRYPKDVWDAKDARAHCENHDGSFEAAEKDGNYPGRLVEQLEAVAGDARKALERLEELSALRAAGGKRPGVETMKRANELKESLEKLSIGIGRLEVVAGDAPKAAEDYLMLVEEIRFALHTTARR